MEKHTEFWKHLRDETKQKIIHHEQKLKQLKEHLKMFNDELKGSE